MSTPRRGDVVDMTIDDWGDRGRGIGRVGRIVVLTDRGLPGDVVRARITRRHRRHLDAAVEEILTSSPHRVDAPCRHFGHCGGCRLLDCGYEHQLADKVRHLREQLHRIGKLEDVPSIDVIPCEPPFRYRNKMEFSFGGSADQFHLGLHPRENFRDAFNLEECHLTDERAAVIVGTIRRFLENGPETPHDPLTHVGFLRFLVVRFGRHTDDVLVNLVTTDEDWPRADEFAACITSELPFVTTALWTVNSGRANIASGTVRRLFFGPGNLHEKLGPFEFEIAAGGFFQTNTAQTERLFARVIEYAEPDAHPVLDLYSGAGAISLFLSQSAAEVTGVESYAESVEAATRNAEHNGVSNCRFVCSDTLEFLRGLPPEGFVWPTIVLDPPRAGLHPKVIKALVGAKPRRCVYVSCNTGALVRDLALCGGAFRLAKLSAVDMFPHTPHIEAVALLERSGE
ncbi:MAG TPA: 23S rRNA (uracil(1939)-C(5))-methyltransferase RlmD [Acidobacteriota bacterium]|nr:23S rRNA (uracil(1939)-C(5))-methyltransferase RlmD [Acidobacteriota bacterium]